MASPGYEIESADAALDAAPGRRVTIDITGSAVTKIVVGLLALGLC